MKNKIKTMKLRAIGTAVLFSLYVSSVWAFNIDDVAKQAQNLARKDFETPKSNLPSSLRELKFADYQQIQFNQDKAWWRNLNTLFKLEFYHQGMYFDTPVKLNEVTATNVREIKYNSDYFNFGNIKHDAEMVKNLGFAGFNVLYPLNNKDKNEGISSFLGASYFRVIGANQVYGLSARGLAIDTALPSGEEFPRFKEFWIERPKSHDKHLIIYALLDSPRAVGAYRFVIKPGEETTIDVETKIYLRDKVDKLGVAPLTSMFLFGSSQPSPIVNYRPALHDSNGLSIHTNNGEWIWRPLNNPKHLAVSTFFTENPKGFGLLQRDRDFSHFQDLNERYDQRPSSWIEPQGEWGKGRVELVEIPTVDETNDNIVVFWAPETLPEPGKEIHIKYRLHFTRDQKNLHPPETAYVKSTLRSMGNEKQSSLMRQSDGTITFVVDFVGQEMSALAADTPVTSQVSIGKNGEIIEQNVQYNPVTKGRRLVLRLRVKDNKQPTEMRAELVNGDKPLTETWSYQLPANE